MQPGTTSNLTQSSSTSYDDNGRDHPSGTSHPSNTTAGSPSTAPCTPLLLTAITPLLNNLMLHLPDVALPELVKLRVSALLMNIVDFSESVHIGRIRQFIGGSVDDTWDSEVDFRLRG